MSPRILSSSPLVGPYLGALGSDFPDLQIIPFDSAAWHASLPLAEAMVVLLSEPVPEAMLARAHRLKVLATYSVGTNHLPVEACQARGIQVVNTPGVLTDATADLALTLLLAVTRRVAEGEALVRSGHWRGWAPDQLLGSGLTGKTCGILGAGAIGKAFARRAWALGMEVAFWDRSGEGGSVSFGPTVGPRLPLENLLVQSQVLSLHCPLTAETRGLLSASRLDLLPKGAVLINTARGGILDECAALDRLASGQLGGIGLDVYDQEPQLDPRWLDAPRTVLLPHLGSATEETREAMTRLLCNGVRAALSGAEPPELG